MPAGHIPQASMLFSWDLGKRYQETPWTNWALWLLPISSCYASWQLRGWWEKSYGSQKELQGARATDWRNRYTGGVFLNPLRNAERTGEPTWSTCGLKAISGVLVFAIMGQFPWHQACWRWMGVCLSKSPWVGRDDWESLKLGLKEEGDKTRLGRDEPECSLQCWRWNQ